MIRQAAAVVVALCLSASPLHAQNAPSTMKLTVSEASADVHKTPSMGSPVIGKAPRGTELVVTREVGDWVKVAWPSSADGAGYVRAGALTRVNTAAPAAQKAPATANAAAAAKAAPASANAKSAATAKAAPAASPRATAANATPSEPALSAKAAVTGTPTAAPIAVRNEQLPPPSRPSSARTLYVAPTHIFGVGAVAGGSTMGFGGSARAWKKDRLGVQLEVSRYTFDSIDLLSRATSTDIAPAILFALNDRVSDYLWLRPYVGAGAHVIRTSRTDLIFTDVTENANTLGVRAFFGAEMAFSSVPQFALSTDIGYYKLPEPFVGFEPGGMGFAISGHWYVK